MIPRTLNVAEHKRAYSNTFIRYQLIIINAPIKNDHSWVNENIKLQYLSKGVKIIAKQTDISINVILKKVPTLKWTPKLVH